MGGLDGTDDDDEEEDEDEDEKIRQDTDGDGHIEPSEGMRNGAEKKGDGDDYIAPDGSSTSSGDDDGYYDDDTKARSAKLAHRLQSAEQKKGQKKSSKKMLHDFLGEIGSGDNEKMKVEHNIVTTRGAGARQRARVVAPCEGNKCKNKKMMDKKKKKF